MTKQDTIAAIATPTGRGGIGVIRVSGPRSKEICQAITGKSVKAGHYYYATFTDNSGKLIDKGIALYFENPHSYTGEDVVEFQTHGSDVVLQMLLDVVCASGARLARAGEFTERAFLNHKVDLVQAEAVMDLIDSKSKSAARAALRSLEGVFSKKVESIYELVFNARALLEASLDFPDEEDVDVDITPVETNIQQAMAECSQLVKNATAGMYLSKGYHVVIVGRPNVGKSSLLNLLAGNDIAIVSSIPGTTRDMVRQSILLDGIELMLVDTAGVRESEDEIEKLGIDRSFKSIARADLVLYVYDDEDEQSFLDDIVPQGVKKMLVRNKIDVMPPDPERMNNEAVAISVKSGEGIEQLITRIHSLLKSGDSDENTVSARNRHLEALNTALKYLQDARDALQQEAGHELVGEQLRQVLLSFENILGRTTADDILGRIFSEFCIGK